MIETVKILRCAQVAVHCACVMVRMSQATSMPHLQKLFGRSREEIWKQLSQQIDGAYTPRSFWKGDKIQFQHDEWTVTLEIHKEVIATGKSTVVITYTRFRAPYVNPRKFRFSIYKKTFFSEIAKFVGMQDVEVGHAQFNDRFIIKGEDQEKIRRLFQHSKLRQALLNQSEVHVSEKDAEGWIIQSFRADVDELQLVVQSKINEVDRLKSLYEAFAICLDVLHEMGGATKADPGRKL